MKKLAVILILVVMGLAFGCNAEESKGGQKSRVVFEPIPKERPVGNYTDYEKDEKATIECQLKNLNKLVGMTFMAYPDTDWSPFSQEVSRSNTNFNVRSPEKFKIMAIQSNDVIDENAKRIKVKFESGKIAYLDVFLGRVVFGFCNGKEKSFPDLFKVISIIQRISEE